MAKDESALPKADAKPRYTWPWFVAGAVLLAIVLAVLWMSKEIDRTRRIREANSPTPQTNSAGLGTPRK